MSRRLQQLCRRCSLVVALVVLMVVFIGCEEVNSMGTGNSSGNDQETGAELHVVKVEYRKNHMVMTECSAFSIGETEEGILFTAWMFYEEDNAIQQVDFQDIPVVAEVWKELANMIQSREGARISSTLARDPWASRMSFVRDETTSGGAATWSNSQETPLGDIEEDVVAYLAALAKQMYKATIE